MLLSNVPYMCQLAGHELRDRASRSSGEGGRAEGADAGALFAVGHALDVAAEHPSIGEQVMGEADGLRGGWRWSTAGEDGVWCSSRRGPCIRRPVRRRALPHSQAGQRANRQNRAQPEPLRLRPVWSFLPVAHEFGEAAFDVHVNVFGFSFSALEGAVLNFPHFTAARP